MFMSRFALVSTTALLLAACGGAASGGSDPGSTNSGGPTPVGTSPGGSGFYLPFVATTSSSGESDLFVIPSNDLSSTPILVTRTAANAQTGLDIVDYTKKPTVNGSNVVTSSSPYALVYVTVGSDNNAHVYALNLSDATVAPGATQVSNLSLSSMTDICEPIGSAQTNLYDPTTLFLVLHTNAGGASSCGNGGDVYQVVHYTDSSATAPAVVNITKTTLLPLYRTGGSLGGLVLLDSASGNLDFFAGESFTSPAVLASGVTSSSGLFDDRTVNNTGSLGAGTAFLLLTTSSGKSVWRVDSSGAAADVYTPVGMLSAVVDTHNVYFSDTVVGGTQKIYQEALSGGTPLELYSTPVSAGLPQPPPYSLIGSNGTLLVLTSTTLGAISSPTLMQTSVLTLTVGVPGAPASIAGPFSGTVNAWMCPSSFGDVASDDLLLNVDSNPAMVSTMPTTYSSEVLTPSGVVKQPARANSAFLIAGVPDIASLPDIAGISDTCALNPGSVLQVRDITDTSGGYGGGTVNALNLNSLSATALSTTSGSGTYTVPAGEKVQAAIFLSDVIGSGAVGAFPGGVSSGLAFDLSKSLIVPVTVPDSNVGPIL